MTASLQTMLVTLLNWFLYAGILLGIGCMIVSIVMLARGSEVSKRLFLSGLAALILGSAANQILHTLLAGIKLGPPADFVSAAVVACLIVCSVLFFAFGRAEQGFSYAVAAVLAAGFIAMIPALHTLAVGAPAKLAGTCLLDVKVSNANPAAGQPVNFTVTMPYGAGSYALNVNYGDGTTDCGTISPGSEVSFSHAFAKPGAYAVSFRAWNNGSSCYYVAGLDVGRPPSPWFLGLVNFGGFFSRIQDFMSIPLNYLFWAPEFDLTKDSTDMRLYTTVTAVALTALALFLAIRIVSGFLEDDPGSAVVDSIKEAVVVLLVIMLAPYLYQVFAFFCNRITNIVVSSLNVPASFVTIVSFVAAAFFLGTFNSFIGSAGSFFLKAFALTNFVVVMRYVLIKALILCAPFLAVAYLFPPAKGAVRFFMSVLAGLVLAGPITAFAFAALAHLGGAGTVGATVAPVLMFTAFPLFLAAATGASPVEVGRELFGHASGALAGLRGGDGSAAPAPSGGGGGSGGTATVSGRAFVTRADYAGSSGGAGVGSTEIVPVSSDSAEPASFGQRLRSAPRAAARAIASIPSRVAEAHRRFSEWYENSVFRQRIYPRWRSFVSRFEGWWDYGHHVVMGKPHPISHARRDGLFRDNRTGQGGERIDVTRLDRDINDFMGGSGPF